jgi:hypothetical protein
MPYDPPGGGNDDLLRSTARLDARAARLGKPHEFNPSDGAWIVAGEGARDETRCDCIMYAFRQEAKGRAPVQKIGPRH